MPYSRGTDSDAAARFFVYLDGHPVAMSPSGYGKSDHARINALAALISKANAFDRLTQEVASLRAIIEENRREARAEQDRKDMEGR